MLINLNSLPVELVRQLLNDRLGERVHGDPGRPERKARWEDFDGWLRVWVLGVFDGDRYGVLFDLLHSGVYEEKTEVRVSESCTREIRREGRWKRTSHNPHVLPSEPLLGVLRNLLRVSVENVISRLDDRHRQLRPQQLGEVSERVLVEEVDQLGREFDAGWSSSADDAGGVARFVRDGIVSCEGIWRGKERSKGRDSQRQQLLPLLWGRRGQTSQLEVV